MPRGSDDRTRTVPLHEEVAAVSKRTEERRKRINKRVSARTETVGALVQREDLTVERVPVNRVVTTAPPVREEGDTLIIPVLEEVAVVERRLVLREEVRVRKSKRSEPFSEEVTLRSEDIEIVDEPSSETEGAARRSTKTPQTE